MQNQLRSAWDIEAEQGTVRAMDAVASGTASWTVKPVTEAGREQHDHPRQWISEG